MDDDVETKWSRGGMERHRGDARVVFQPIIFESTGGVPAEADWTSKCLNKAVAGNPYSSDVVVATQFWQRIGIDLARNESRALRKRIVDKGGEDCGAGGFFLTAAGMAAPAHV